MAGSELTMNPNTEQHTGVTLLIRRTVKTGCEAQYETWLSSVLAQARERCPGYLGADLHRPTAPSREYRSILHFASVEDLEAFESAPWRLQRMREVAGLVDSDSTWDRLTGLELWFDAPPGTPIPKPSPFRMALVLIVVVFTLAVILGQILAAVVPSWPVLLRQFIAVCIQVVLMTWWIMPLVTRRLAGWIYLK